MNLADLLRNPNEIEENTPPPPRPAERQEVGSSKRAGKQNAADLPPPSAKKRKTERADGSSSRKKKHLLPPSFSLKEQMELAARQALKAKESLDRGVITEPRESRNLFASHEARPDYLFYRYDDFIPLTREKEACGHLMYSMRDKTASFPPVRELEEREAYFEVAQSQMKTSALLNNLVLKYQNKLEEARKAALEAGPSDELKKELADSNKIRSDLMSEVSSLKAEIVNLKAEVNNKGMDINKLTDMYNQQRSGHERWKANCDREEAENKRLREELDFTNARVERLRNKLTYLDKAAQPLSVIRQAKGVLECLEEFSISLPEKEMQLEGVIELFENQLLDIEKVELAEGDWTSSVPAPVLTLSSSSSEQDTNGADQNAEVVEQPTPEQAAEKQVEEGGTVNTVEQALGSELVEQDVNDQIPTMGTPATVQTVDPRTPTQNDDVE